MPLTAAEEDYLKAIYQLSERQGVPVGTSAIAERLGMRAASVTDMLRRLSEKELVRYERYQGVSLTREGNRAATMLVRRHRLWEVFLAEKLGFSWDEVHDIAEQLEHVRSGELIERLDSYLGSPRFDPHGDPIPDAAGAYLLKSRILLRDLPHGQDAVMVGVLEHGTEFLRYLDKTGLGLGTRVRILEETAFDGSLLLLLEEERQATVSASAAAMVFVQQAGGLEGRG